MVAKPKFRIVPDEREPDRCHVFVMRGRNGWTPLYRETLSRTVGDAEAKRKRDAGFEVLDERALKV